MSSVPEFTRRKVIRAKREAKLEQEEGSECAEAARDAVLYLFGQQNMSLFLLYEEALGKDPQLIHCLVSTLELQYDCSIVLVFNYHIHTFSGFSGRQMWPENLFIINL
jgi:hypothetical protein